LYLLKLGKKRFANNTERDAIDALYAEVGAEIFDKALTWAALNGIAKAASVIKGARTIAKGESRKEKDYGAGSAETHSRPPQGTGKYAHLST
jgi:hypothetical protein